MRLTKNEIEFIKNAVRQKDAKAKVFVFGSRLHDDLAGGDIDLVIESRLISFKDKISILAEIKNKLGDQKIDLILSEDINQDTDAFIKLIRKEIQQL